MKKLHIHHTSANPFEILMLVGTVSTLATHNQSKLERHSTEDGDACYPRHARAGGVAFLQQLHRYDPSKWFMGDAGIARDKKCKGKPYSGWGGLCKGCTSDECKSACVSNSGCYFATYRNNKCSAFKSCNELQTKSGFVVWKKMERNNEVQVDDPDDGENCIDKQPSATTCAYELLYTSNCTERREGRLRDGYCLRTCGVCGNVSQCVDKQPPKTWKYQTCTEQLQETNNCELRRAGLLGDGLCEKTCGVCSDIHRCASSGKITDCEQLFQGYGLTLRECEDKLLANAGDTINYQSSGSCAVQRCGAQLNYVSGTDDETEVHSALCPPGVYPPEQQAAQIRISDTSVEDQNIMYKNEEGRAAQRRLITRPVFQKRYRCTGVSSASCEECVPEPSCTTLLGCRDKYHNCFGLETRGSAHGSIQVLATPSKDSSLQRWKRFVVLVHVQCASPTLSVEISLLNVRYGTLRLYWDGVEVQSPSLDSEVSVAGLIPLPVVADAMNCRITQKYMKDATNILTMNVSHAGAHEFMIEFTPADSVATSAQKQDLPKHCLGGALNKPKTLLPKTAPAMQIGKLAFFMADEYAQCEDMKVCLLELQGEGSGKVQLRASNILQLECLRNDTAGFSVSVLEACEVWRSCLSGTAPHAARLEELMVAAGVGLNHTEYSEAPGTEQCINPPTEDVESWECDCYEEMLNRCIALQSVISVSISTCLKAQYCEHPRICASWANTTCHDEDTNRVRNALRRLSSLEIQDDQSGLLASRRNTRSIHTGREAKHGNSERLDRTYASKHCS